MSAALACPLTCIMCQLMGSLAGNQSVGREKGHGIYSPGSLSPFTEGGRRALCLCPRLQPVAHSPPQGSGSGRQEGLPQSAPSALGSLSLCGSSPVLHQPLCVTLNTAYCCANKHFNQLPSAALFERPLSPARPLADTE